MGKITVEQAANIIGVTPGHVRTLHQRGKLHGERVGQRVLVFDVAEVEAYARQTFSRGWSRGRPRGKRIVAATLPETIN